MMDDASRELDGLGDLLRPFHLVMTRDRKQRLRRYTAELIAWNRRYALLSRQDAHNVVRKHVAASLGPLLLSSPGEGKRWADIGTGAGLPGMVLKLWEPSQEVTLIDGSQKKCRFLQHVVRELALAPIPILAIRVESLVHRGELVERFDLLLVRAVADLEKTLRLFSPLLRTGGRLITYKGPNWRDDFSGAQKAGHFHPERFLLEEVVRIPWAPGHLLSIRKRTPSIPGDWVGPRSPIA